MRSQIDDEALVNAGRSLPIENVNQIPGVPNEIHLQLSLLIDHELGCRVQHARALALVRIIHVEFASRQVVVGRSGVPVHLPELRGRLVTKRIFRPVGVGIIWM